MRLVIARCSVDYAGRLSAHLPSATRLLLIKADGSLSVHADDRAYKPLNWMSPPCSFKETEDNLWTVTNKAGEQLIITIEEILHDSSHELGVDPGLIKDGVEAHLQELLADRVEVLGEGWTLIRREYPTAIGPVDILCRDVPGATVAIEVERPGAMEESQSSDIPELPETPVSRHGIALPRPRHWAVEIKRRATIDGVEQLTRYLEYLNRDTTLAPVGGVLAAQSIAPQARTLAEDRGIRCVVLDYDELRGIDKAGDRLF
jgi:RecB family endonuclease NucS